MCGIFAVYSKNGFAVNTKELINKYIKNGKIMENRGDDNTYRLINNKLFLFHNRLQLDDFTRNEIQPMIKNNIMVILNGKITNYNVLYKMVIDKNPNHNFKSKSHSEILISLYLLLGSAFISELKGMFSFVLYDSNKDIFIASRDHIGLTSLYYSLDGNNQENIIISSEIKSIINIAKTINIFQPGQTYINNTFFNHYSPEWRNDNYIAMGDVNYEIINKKLTESVLEYINTINSNQTIGVVLSGKLESNILIAIIMKLKKDNLINNPIKTFSIGLENSLTTGISNVDISDKVSKYLGCDHNSYTYDIEDIEDILEDIIYYLESYNVDNIRESIPIYLLAMQIQEEYNIKILISDEILDKLFITSGDLDFSMSDILNNLHKRELCRIHKILMSNKIEAILPFSNDSLIDYIINIDTKYKLIYTNDEDKNIDKYILRNSFINYLPKDILWHLEDKNELKYLYEGLINYSNKVIVSEEYNKKDILYPVNTPTTKEEFLYRKIFEMFYKNESCIKICD